MALAAPRQRQLLTGAFALLMLFGGTLAVAWGTWVLVLRIANWGQLASCPHYSKPRRCS